MRTVILGLLIASLAQAQDDWVYIVPPLGAEQRHPPMTALALGTQVPDGMTVSANFRGAIQRYGLLRYGDENSTRVTIVLDQLDATHAELYVDGNRDKRIEASDRVGAAGSRWELPLVAATMTKGAPEFLPRQVVFQLGRTGSILSYATLGFLEGSTQLGERRVMVQRKDGDGNGFFTDSRDHLWVDLDGDLTWSPMEELFLYAPILTIQEQRWALRSDRAGESLSFEKLDAVGHLRLELPTEPGFETRTVAGLNVLLVGRDGSAVGVRSLGQSVEVPAGDYRVGMATLRLQSEVGPIWSFIFSEPGARTDLTWITIGKDQKVLIDPLGELLFEVGDGSSTCAPGASLDASPQLSTAGGLQITTAYHGRETRNRGGTLAADIRLLDPSGRTLATASSGFN